jgi:hypothetical protein
MADNDPQQQHPQSSCSTLSPPSLLHPLPLVTLAYADRRPWPAFSCRGRAQRCGARQSMTATRPRGLGAVVVTSWVIAKVADGEQRPRRVWRPRMWRPRPRHPPWRPAAFGRRSFILAPKPKPWNMPGTYRENFVMYYCCQRWVSRLILSCAATPAKVLPILYLGLFDSFFSVLILCSSDLASTEQEGMRSCSWFGTAASKHKNGLFVSFHSGKSNAWCSEDSNADDLSPTIPLRTSSTNYSDEFRRTTGKLVSAIKPYEGFGDVDHTIKELMSLWVCFAA